MIEQKIKFIELSSITIIVLSMAYTFWSTQNPERLLRGTHPFLMSDNPVNTQDIVSARNIKPLSDYQAQINQRNIFTLTEENGLDKSNKGVDLSVEISNELNLVGLVADKIPQAVIVDQVDHKTYFVKPGESVHGATVLEIHNDNVLLRANGQNITLMRK